jgi:hypothetical protein
VCEKADRDLWKGAPSGARTVPGAEARSALRRGRAADDGSCNWYGYHAERDREAPVEIGGERVPGSVCPCLLCLCLCVSVCESGVRLCPWRTRESDREREKMGRQTGDSEEWGVTMRLNSGLERALRDQERQWNSQRSGQRASDNRSFESLCDSHDSSPLRVSGGERREEEGLRERRL